MFIDLTLEKVSLYFDVLVLRKNKTVHGLFEFEIEINMFWKLLLAKWDKLQDKVELCNNTLVYADIVEGIEFV